MARVDLGAAGALVIGFEEVVLFELSIEDREFVFSVVDAVKAYESGKAPPGDATKSSSPIVEELPVATGQRQSEESADADPAGGPEAASAAAAEASPDTGGPEGDVATERPRSAAAVGGKPGVILNILRQAEGAISLEEIREAALKEGISAVSVSDYLYKLKRRDLAAPAGRGLWRAVPSSPNERDGAAAAPFHYVVSGDGTHVFIGGSAPFTGGTEQAPVEDLEEPNVWAGDQDVQAESSPPHNGWAGSLSRQAALLEVLGSTEGMHRSEIKAGLESRGIPAGAVSNLLWVAQNRGLVVRLGTGYWRAVETPPAPVAAEATSDLGEGSGTADVDVEIEEALQEQPAAPASAPVDQPDLVYKAIIDEPRQEQPARDPVGPASAKAPWRVEVEAERRAREDSELAAKHGGVFEALPFASGERCGWHAGCAERSERVVPSYAGGRLIDYFELCRHHGLIKVASDRLSVAKVEEFATHARAAGLFLTGAPQRAMGAAV